MMATTERRLVHPVLLTADRQRAKLAARNATAMRQLATAYARSLDRLQGAILALDNRIQLDIQKNGPEVALSRPRVKRLEEMTTLYNQLRDEMQRLGVYTQTTIDDLVMDAIRQGNGDALQLVQAHFPAASVRNTIAARWVRLPVEASEIMVGMTQPDSPLTLRLAEVFDGAADTFRDAMVEGIVLGRNPRAVARSIHGRYLTDALRNARTAQVWSYREATRANYTANSDVVSGWRWYAELDDDTCASCIAQHGTIHGNDEVLNDHYNGRCASIPIVPLAERLGIPPPADATPEAAQRFWDSRTDDEKLRHMGNNEALLRAYKDNAIRLDQLSAEYSGGEVVPKVYGTMRTVPGLNRILGDEAAKAYYAR